MERRARGNKINSNLPKMELSNLAGFSTFCYSGERASFSTNDRGALLQVTEKQHTFCDCTSVAFSLILSCLLTW